jgi:hypothetical protein
MTDKSMARSEEMKNEDEIAGELPQIYFKYDECVEVFWKNPWDGKEEKLFMMMWPGHPPEATAKVEEWYQEYARQFCSIARERAKVHSFILEVKGLLLTWQFTEAFNRIEQYQKDKL